MMEVSPDYCDAIVDRYKRLMERQQAQQAQSNDGQQEQPQEVEEGQGDTVE